MSRFRFSTSLLALLAALTTGCATGGTDTALDQQLGLPEAFGSSYRAEPMVHRLEVGAPVGRVQDAIAKAYEELGLPAVSDDGRIFTTPALKIQGRLYEGERNSEYFSCGTTMSGERADQSELEFVARSRVKAGEAGGSVVETVMGAIARDRYAGAGTVPCRSTGRLETQLERRIQLRLGG